MILIHNTRVQYPAVDNTGGFNRDPVPAVCWQCGQPLPLGGGVQAYRPLTSGGCLPVLLHAECTGGHL